MMHNSIGLQSGAARSATSSWLRWMAGVLAVLLLALGTLGAAQAAPMQAQQSYRVNVRPAGPLEICKGQSTRVRVTVDVLTRRRAGSRPAARRIRGGGWAITPEVSSSAVGLSPSSGNVASAGTSFTVTGSEVGAAVILFRLAPGGPEEDLAPLVPGPVEASGARRGGVGYLQVVVKECKFLVVVVSTWTIQDGWIPRMSSTVAADILPNADGSFVVDAPVENRVRHLIPLPGCSKTVEAGPTEATIIGSVNPDTGVLDFDVNYTTVQASTKIRCPIPGGFVGAGSQDEANVHKFDPRPLNIRIAAGRAAISRGTGGTFRHEMEAYVGIVSGRGIYVIVPR